MLASLLDQRVISWDSTVAAAGAGAARARMFTRTTCPEIPIQETELVSPPGALTPGTGVLVAQGSFQHPDQTDMASVDQYVPAQIPFQPKFIYFTTTNRDVHLQVSDLYGFPDNTTPGEVYRGISMAQGFALYSETPGTVRQFVHASEIRHNESFGVSSHKLVGPHAVAFYGPHYFILPGTSTADVHEYTLAGGNYDLTIRWAIPRDGVGAATPFPAGGMVRWVAFGGDDITDVALVNWGVENRDDATYTMDVTTQYPAGPDIGFKPDFLWTLYWIGGTEDDTFQNSRRHGIGWANCVGEQVTTSVLDGTFEVPTRSRTWQQNDAMAVIRASWPYSGPGSGSGREYIRLHSMLDSGGFRITVDQPDETLPSADGGLLTLAVKGLSSKIGRVVLPATVVPTTGVSPRVLLTASNGQPPNESDDIQTWDRMSYGVRTEDAQWCVATDFPDGQSFNNEPFGVPGSGGAHSVDIDDAVIAKITSPTGSIALPGSPASVDVVASAPSFSELSVTEYDDSGMEVLTCVLGSGGGGTCAGPAVGFPLPPPCQPFLPPLCVVPETP